MRGKYQINFGGKFDKEIDTAKQTHQHQNNMTRYLNWY
jgi:hypothetical protein